jgi:hypothetical protein
MIATGVFVLGSGMASAQPSPFSFPYSYGQPAVPSNIGAQGTIGPTEPASQALPNVGGAQIGTSGPLGPAGLANPAALGNTSARLTLIVKDGNLSSSVGRNGAVAVAENVTTGWTVSNTTAGAGETNLTVSQGWWLLKITNSNPAWVNFTQELYVASSHVTLTRFLLPIAATTHAVSNGAPTSNTVTFFALVNSEPFYYSQNVTGLPQVPVELLNASSGNAVLATSYTLPNGTAEFTKVNFNYDYVLEAIGWNNSVTGVRYSLMNQSTASLTALTNTVHVVPIGVLGGDSKGTAAVTGSAHSRFASGWSLTVPTTVSGGVFYWSSQLSGPTSGLVGVTFSNTWVVINASGNNLTRSSHVGLTFLNSTVVELTESNQLGALAYLYLNNTRVFGSAILGSGIGGNGWDVTSATSSIISNKDSWTEFPYVNITIANGQANATGQYDQLVDVNSQLYNPYINQNWTNVRFTYQNGTAIPAWIESNATWNSPRTAVWLRLNSIGGSSSVVIRMAFTYTFLNLLNPKGSIGEAPQLSSVYGQYDNGALVFPKFYDNFTTSAGFTGWGISHGAERSFHGLQLWGNSSAGVYVNEPTAPGIGQSFSANMSSNVDSDGGLFADNGGDYAGGTGTAFGCAIGSYYPGLATFTPNNFNVITLTGTSNGMACAYNEVTLKTNHVASTINLGGAGIQTQSTSTYLDVHWVRNTVAPPNNVMPTVSFSGLLFGPHPTHPSYPIPAYSMVGGRLSNSLIENSPLIVPFNLTLASSVVSRSVLISTDQSLESQGMSYNFSWTRFLDNSTVYLGLGTGTGVTRSAGLYASSVNDSMVSLAGKYVNVTDTWLNETYEWGGGNYTTTDASTTEAFFLGNSAYPPISTDRITRSYLTERAPAYVNWANYYSNLPAQNLPPLPLGCSGGHFSGSCEKVYLTTGALNISYSTVSLTTFPDNNFTINNAVSDWYDDYLYDNWTHAQLTAYIGTGQTDPTEGAVQILSSNALNVNYTYVGCSDFCYFNAPNNMSFNHDYWPWAGIYQYYPLQMFGNQNDHPTSTATVANNVFAYISNDYVLAHSLGVALLTYWPQAPVQWAEDGNPSVAVPQGYFNVTHNTFLARPVGVGGQVPSGGGAPPASVSVQQMGVHSNVSYNLFDNLDQYNQGPNASLVAPYGSNVYVTASPSCPIYDNWFLNLDNETVPVLVNPSYQAYGSGWMGSAALLDNEYFYAPAVGQTSVAAYGELSTAPGPPSPTDFWSGIPKESTVTYEIPVSGPNGTLTEAGTGTLVSNASVVQTTPAHDWYGTTSWSWSVAPDVVVPAGVPDVAYANGYAAGPQPNFYFGGSPGHRYNYTEFVEPAYVGLAVNSSSAPAVSVGLSGPAGPAVVDVLNLTTGSLISESSVTVPAGGLYVATFTPSTESAGVVLELISEAGFGPAGHVNLAPVVMLLFVGAIAGTIVYVTVGRRRRATWRG